MSNFTDKQKAEYQEYVDWLKRRKQHQQPASIEVFTAMTGSIDKAKEFMQNLKDQENGKSKQEKNDFKGTGNPSDN